MSWEQEQARAVLRMRALSDEQLRRKLEDLLERAAYRALTETGVAVILGMVLARLESHQENPDVALAMRRIAQAAQAVRRSGVDRQKGP